MSIWKSLNRDLKSPKLIYLKGVLFLLIGLLAAAGLLLESPSFRTACFIVLLIWGFCRFYYFAFYVIENYVDPSFRFSGLGSFLRYLWSKK
jgi:hypothetical protein